MLLEWTKIPALRTVMKIVCRTSNRLFVGLPLCMYFFFSLYKCLNQNILGRNPDYRALNEEFTISVFKGGYIINLFPNILKPSVHPNILTKKMLSLPLVRLAGRLLTNVPASIKRAMAHLGPIIQDRLDKEEQYGPNWPGKPVSGQTPYPTGYPNPLQFSSLERPY